MNKFESPLKDEVDQLKSKSKLIKESENSNYELMINDYINSNDLHSYVLGLTCFEVQAMSVTKLVKPESDIYIPKEFRNDIESKVFALYPALRGYVNGMFKRYSDSTSKAAAS